VSAINHFLFVYLSILIKKHCLIRQPNHLVRRQLASIDIGSSGNSRCGIVPGDNQGSVGAKCCGPSDPL